jgi:hypothetical protein
MNKQNKQTKPEKCYAVPGQAAYMDTWCNQLVADGAHTCAEIEKVFPTFCTTNPPSSPTAPATPVPSPTAAAAKQEQEIAAAAAAKQEQEIAAAAAKQEQEIAAAAAKPSYNCKRVGEMGTWGLGLGQFTNQQYLEKVGKDAPKGTITHEQFINNTTNCQPFSITCSGDLIKDSGSCILSTVQMSKLPYTSSAQAIHDMAAQFTTCKSSCAVCPKPTWVQWHDSTVLRYSKNSAYAGTCKTGPKCFQVEADMQTPSIWRGAKSSQTPAPAVCCTPAYNAAVQANLAMAAKTDGTLKRTTMAAQDFASIFPTCTSLPNFKSSVQQYRGLVYDSGPSESNPLPSTF